MNTALVERVRAVLEGNPRKHVLLSDIVAVIEKESSGVAVFNKTDDLFRDNLRAAIRITGLPEELILKAVTIQSGPLKGSIAKFRCEPGYWRWANGLTNRPWTKEERFLLSCSFGLGQKMARWLVTGVAPGDWMSIIRQFMGSEKLQINYCAGDLEQLLNRYGGDRPIAFTCYNAGHDRAKEYWKAAMLKYGKPVADKAAQLEKELKKHA